jgi:hypothetical protein
MKHDPWAFVHSAHLLQKVVHRLSDAWRDDLHSALRRIEDNVYLGLTISAETCASLARAFCIGGWPEDAARVLLAADAQFGSDEERLRLLARAHEECRRHAPALECIERLLAGLSAAELDEEALARRVSLEAQAARLSRCLSGARVQSAA